jgi:hypothetical protein
MHVAGFASNLDCLAGEVVGRHAFFENAKEHLEAAKLLNICGGDITLEILNSCREFSLVVVNVHKAKDVVRNLPGLLLSFLAAIVLDLGVALGATLLGIKLNSEEFQEVCHSTKRDETRVGGGGSLD